VDIHLELDRAAPLRAQLERELRTAIRSGRLRAGAKLPPSRLLADELRVSRGVVVEAYSQLVAEGYLVARSGDGTRIADGLAQQPPARRAAFGTTCEAAYPTCPTFPGASGNRR
jgi:GntR family transcriptional regulator / MocR family aminotransferase